MSVDMYNVMSRYRETYRVLKIAVLISVLGLGVELVFAYLSSSIIIYTDVIHWATDISLELVSMITFYIISRVYRRIKWNVFALESLLILALTFVIFGFYSILLINTVRSYMEASQGPTTTNPYLAFVTAFGGILTLAIFIIERKAYHKLKTDILKVDSTHALIDIAVAIVATVGILITVHTMNFIVELTIVLFVLFAALQTLVDLVKEAVKSVLGFEADPKIKLKLVSRISELNRENVKIGEVELRKMGTFYVAKINVYLDPSITIGEAHKLRKMINIACREAIDLIYHVDVFFYPMKKLEKRRKKDKHRRQRQQNQLS